MSEFNWLADGVIDELTRRWGDGESASQIAKAMGGGLTRSAVIGKVHRLGIQRRFKAWTPGVATPRQRVERKPREVSEKAPREAVGPLARRPQPVAVEHLWKRDHSAPVAPSHPTLRCAVVSPNAKPWTERRRGQCAFPLDGPVGADTVSCCNPTQGDRPYCQGHAAFVYRPGEPTPIKAPADHSTLKIRKAA